MKKKLLFAAIALTAMASCTEDSFVGEQSQQEANASEGAISFNLNTAGVTRANKEGSDAATDLGNYFIIYGEKGETSKDKYTAGNLVFPNYTVNYAANTAYTTTSNTKNWEYVGVTPISITNVKMSDGNETTAVTADPQTIKYWDYGAASYTFTAVSAKKEDIEDGRVVIQKNTVGTTDEYDKGYTITLAKSGSGPSYTYPTVNKLFLADRKVITKSTGTDRDATNAYGGNVTMQFRNFVSQIRAGVYETIPGYDITAISFYVNTTGGSPTQTQLAQVSSVNAFGAVCPNISTTNYEGTLTVTYYNSGAVVNQPKVTATGTPATNLILGTYMSTISDATDNQLGKTATAPTWDQSGGAFTEVMPQIENADNLKLKCNYTLWNKVTKETITVESATAEVPAQYLQWKPNYKYTYLFKISDNTNGSSGTPGTDPAGLYPITFDAVEVVAEDGKAEYITTVSEPSITTIGAIYNTTSTKYTSYQTGKNEYQAQTGDNRLDIFATFTEGSTVQTPVLGTSGAQHVNVFNVTTTDATLYPITEASVAEAIANPNRIINAVYTCAVTDVTAKVATDLSDANTYYKKDANNKAPGDAGYVPTLAVKNTDYTIGATTAENTITAGVNIYTCTVTYSPVASPADLTTGTTYYLADGSSKTPGTTGYEPTIAVTGTDYQVAPKVAATNINSDAATYFFAIPAVVTSVPGEDGVDITINALKLTGVKAGTYAIEYEASAAWTGEYKKVYKIIVVQ